MKTSWYKHSESGSLLLFNTMSPLATGTHRAVDEEGPEDDDPEEDGAGGLDDLEVAVLVGEQHHHRQAADDHALQHQQDRPIVTSQR